MQPLTLASFRIGPGSFRDLDPFPSPPALAITVRLAAVLLASAFLLCPLGTRPALAGDLRAGFSKVDITPTQPVTLSGYSSRKDLSQGVHDPLSARVVAFEREGQRLVLVATDLIGFYGGTSDAMRKAILEACDLQASELFLSAIHTHSAPALALDPENGHANNVAYTATLRPKLIESVQAALKDLAPARIGIGSGASPVGANRRETVKDDKGNSRIVLGRNPSVLTDREVQVLKVVPEAGDRLTAVLFAYATHSTSLGPRNYVISGDVHGLAAQFLEKYLGPGVLAPPFAGASGDIDPWFRIRPDFKTANGWLPEPVLLGTLLGEEVAHVLDRIRETTAGGPIGTIFKTVQLPGKERGQAEVSPTKPVPFNITVGRIGEIAFVGHGGEVFNEIGQAIKAGSPFPTTIVITHCNGSAGYVPTRRSYPAGGYEVQTSPFAPGADEMLVEETLGLLRDLNPNQN